MIVCKVHILVQIDWEHPLLAKLKKQKSVFKPSGAVRHIFIVDS